MKKSEKLQLRPAYLTDAYVFLLLTLFLFYFDRSGYLDIQGAKWPVFLLLSGGYVIGTLLLRGELLLVSGERSERRRFTLPQALLTAYLALTLLSALVSPHTKTALLGGTRQEGVLTIGLCVLVCLTAARNGEGRRWMLWLLAAATALQSVLCIVQMYGGNPLGLYPEGVGYADAGVKYSGEYLGTIGNSDFVGAFFALAVPILWVAALRLDGRARLVCLPVLALALFTVWKMRVLSCLVGIGVGAVAALPVVLPASKRVRRAIALVLVLLLLAVLVLVWAADLGGPLHEAHRILHGDVGRNVDSGRMYIWSNVLSRVPERLWLGHGPDTMSFADIKPFERVDETSGVVYIGLIDAAHNEYLNVLYHQGVLALAVYLAALVSLAVLWIRRAREDAFAAILGAAALGYAVQAFFNISTFIVAPMFWLILGLLDTRRVGEAKEAKRERRKNKKT